MYNQVKTILSYSCVATNMTSPHSECGLDESRTHLNSIHPLKWPSGHTKYPSPNSYPYNGDYYTYFHPQPNKVAFCLAVTFASILLLLLLL